MNDARKWILLSLAIAATIWLIWYLFFVWIWYPAEFELALAFRIILSGVIIAGVMAVEIVIFRWLFSR